MKNYFYSLLALLALSGYVKAQTMTNLSISYDNYSNNQILTSTTSPTGQLVQGAFTITNLGSPITATDSITVAVTINGDLYNLALWDDVDSIPDYLPFTSNIPTNGTISYDPGYLDGEITLWFMGIDTFEMCILTYGVGVGSYSPTFAYDTDPSDNKVCVKYTYSSSLRQGAADNLYALNAEAKAYPNPASDRIHFSFTEQDATGAYSVSIMDMSGRTLRQEPIGYSGQSVDISGLESGLYLYMIQSGGQVVEQGRFTVQP